MGETIGTEEKKMKYYELLDPIVLILYVVDIYFYMHVFMLEFMFWIKFIYQ